MGPRMALEYRERAATQEAEGLLVLHHGRGSDELDLFGLADLLDPARRCHVACPRAPLQVPGSPGYHWYLVPKVGYPDHDTFHAARDALAGLHDELWEKTGVDPSRTVLGGFSMGSVMSYAMALSADRPAVAGILAFSGFVPTVEDWEPQPADRRTTRAFVAHGRADPIIDVGFARQARELLEGGGLEVTYRESDAGHEIDRETLEAAAGWLDETVAGADGVRPPGLREARPPS
jgi:phospholipase/carboxylesterase